MATNDKPKSFQERMEKNIWLLVIVLAPVLAVGGLVEIVPLFYLDETMEHKTKAPEIIWDRKDGQSLSDWKAGDGIRPYTPVELAGRDMYLREGCYTCHSQMIRPFRDERDRYGHYSLASESMYDHPFQWGSKRTGPDLARLGGKYSDGWHRKHLRAPRSVVPESVMPNYPWLKDNMLDGYDIETRMSRLSMVGVPYTDADIDGANGQLAGVSEEDAIIAYMQVLGTMAKLDENTVYRD